jgi:hypothetical protein
MIIDVLSDSLKYSFSNPKNFFKFFVLNLLDFLIIPLFFIEGYKYRIVEESLNGMMYSGDELPEFDDWKKLFIDGCKLIILKILTIIPLLLILIALDNFLNFEAYESYMIYPLIFILAIYICVAIPNMIKYNSLVKAFDFKELIEILKEIGFSLIIPIIIAIPVFLRVIDILGNDIVNFLFTGMKLTNFIIFSDSLSAIIISIINTLLINTFLIIIGYRIMGIIYLDVGED